MYPTMHCADFFDETLQNTCMSSSVFYPCRAVCTPKSQSVSSVNLSASPSSVCVFSRLVTQARKFTFGGNITHVKVIDIVFLRLKG